MMSPVKIGALLVCALAVGACRDRTVERTPPAAGERGGTTLTGANIVANDSAVRRIVEARCAREVSCNNVGPDKKYNSRDVCSDKIRADMKNDLNANECPRGIDQKELDECLVEIRNENCGNPIDKLERLAACRTSDLCLKVSEKNR